MNYSKFLLFSFIIASSSIFSMELPEPMTRDSEQQRIIDEQDLIKAELCILCAQDFKPTDKVDRLICNSHTPHIFHTDCLKMWEHSGHNDCPQCRLTLPFSNDMLIKHKLMKENLITSGILLGAVNAVFIGMRIFQNYTGDNDFIKLNARNFLVTLGIVTTSHVLDGVFMTTPLKATIFLVPINLLMYIKLIETAQSK